MTSNDHADGERGDGRLLYIDHPEFRELMEAAREAVKRGDAAQALALLLRVPDISDSYPDWQAAAALADRTVRTMEGVRTKRTLRLWIASSYTVTPFTPLLRLAALRDGIRLEIQEGNYGQFQQDILDPASPLYESEPECVLLAVHAGDVTLAEAPDDPEAEVWREAQRWRHLCSTIADRCGARVILHNFAVPEASPFGHLARHLPGSRFSMLGRLNDILARDAVDAVSIVDCDRLSSFIGKRHWFDPRYWHLSRSAYGFAALPTLARHTSGILAAYTGLSKKCIVLDLDNTLWGGVIGEDGVDGILIGGPDPEGEAYQDFQIFLKGLKQRGVLLAIASKNNVSDAQQPFRVRPEMILSLEDFSSFKPSWDLKSGSIEAIARELDIGIDSIVFVDDNPFERESIRRFLPEVETVVLPRDPSGYREALAMLPLFETSRITREDADRTALYRMRSRASEVAGQTGSLDDFLRSLDMEAEIGAVDEGCLPRVVQLIAKTNQFNLTTKRYDTKNIADLLQNDDYDMFVLRLRDRFGDHGLVSVLGYRRCGDTLDIDLWLMSCRVIGRSVEQTMMEHLIDVAQSTSIGTIRGTFRRTEKNALVQDLYRRLGFACEPGSTDDFREYRLDMDRSPPSNTFIRLG